MNQSCEGINNSLNILVSLFDNSMIIFFVLQMTEFQVNIQTPIFLLEYIHALKRFYRHYMAGILLIRRKTISNQSINQSKVSTFIGPLLVHEFLVCHKLRLVNA